MNQYPGFVPMVVPQPYMVAMPAAIPMTGAGLTPLPQVLHPQVAAAQLAGAPVVTSAVVTAGGTPGLAPGLMSAVRAAHIGMGTVGQGLGSVTQGMGSVGMGLPTQAPVGIPTGTATVIPHPPAGTSPDARKRGFEMDKGKGQGRGGGKFGNRWQMTDPEQDVDEPNIDDSLCVLDHFNSDLNLVIDPDGFGATVLTDPPGFCFTWAGARATYGVCKGKVYYEVHIQEHLPADFGDDHQEVDPHVVRLGWSIDSSSFQLGEEPWSFGYGGTGKFSTNCRFSDYGQRFGAGDVIGAMLDLDSRPATISFTKNGAWLGVALPLHGFPVGSKDMALFPHILSKNCRLKVNFGQMDPWFPPPPGFNYIGQLPQADRVRGMRPPERKSDCEMIMIVGLPGVGKTTWGINMQKSHPEKRYNIIGTDTLIDKMRVMGLPRKRNYHGRWEVLIDKASKCLNKLFQIAGKRKRNYILDQTNVYASARRRKMKFFQGFYRIAAVVQPEDAEMQRRSHKRTVEDGKIVPESAVLEMKANFSLPEDRENLFERIDFIELPRDKVTSLMQQYVREGQERRPAREEVFRHDSRFQGQNQASGYGSGPPGRGPSPMGGGQRGSVGMATVKGEPRWGGDSGQDTSASKRMKLDSARDALGGARHGGGDPSSALDLLKQQYDEAEEPAQWGQGQSGQPQGVGVKDEPQWGPDASAQALYGAPPPHLIQQQVIAAAAGLPIGGPFTTQPPPPPPPVLPGQLAASATGAAFVALAPFQPNAPPPGMLPVMGGLAQRPPGPAGGAGLLGVPPGLTPSPTASHQADIGGQATWQQDSRHGLSQLSADKAPSPAVPGAGGADSRGGQKGWRQQGEEDRTGGRQSGANDGQQALRAQGRDGQRGWQGSGATGASSGWQSGQGRQGPGYDGGRQTGDYGGQSDTRAGGFDTQNFGPPGQSGQPGRRFDDYSRPPPNYRTEGEGRSGGSGDSRQSYGDNRGGGQWSSSAQHGGGSGPCDSGQSGFRGGQRDWKGGQGGYGQEQGGLGQGQGYRPGQQDSRGQGRGDAGSAGRDQGPWGKNSGPGRDRGYGLGGRDSGPGGRDFSPAGRDSRSGGRDFPAGGRDFRPGDRDSERWGGEAEPGGRDLGERGRDSGSGARGREAGSGGRDFGQGGRDSGPGGRDSHSGGSGLGGRDSGFGGRESGPGGDRWSGARHGERGQSDRWGSRQTGGSSSRDRDRDRDGSRDRDRARDSYRDRDRERDRDRGRDRDRDRDQEEPRQRRRKSKWDTPEDDAGPSAGGDSRFPATVKQEPADTGYGAPRQPPPPFQSSQQPPGNSPFPPPQGDRGPPGFSPRGPGFNKTPPPSQPPPAGGPGPMGPGGFKDRSSDLPSLMDVRFGGRPPPAGGPDSMAKDPKSGAGETSLLGPVPSGPPPKFAGTFPGGQKEGTAAVGSPSKGAPPPTDVAPPLPGAPGPDSGPAVRPPFPPGGPGAGPGARFPGHGGAGNMGGGPPRPNFRMDGPRSMQPANPQQNFGPSGPRGPPPMGMNRPPPGMGGPPGGPWNQNRFGGPGRGGPPMGPRFDGPGGPGGRFPGGPGPMRWPRGPR